MKERFTNLLFGIILTVITYYGSVFFAGLQKGYITQDEYNLEEQFCINSKQVTGIIQNSYKEFSTCTYELGYTYIVDNKEYTALQTVSNIDNIVGIIELYYRIDKPSINRIVTDPCEAFENNMKNKKIGDTTFYGIMTAILTLFTLGLGFGTIKEFFASFFHKSEK